jgi:excisionase family DNA binding protein
LLFFSIWPDGTPIRIPIAVPQVLFMQKLMYARLEAAQLLSVSLRKIDELIATKQIETVRVGRRNLVPHNVLERFARNGARKKA